MGDPHYYRPHQLSHKLLRFLPSNIKGLWLAGYPIIALPLKAYNVSSRERAVSPTVVDSVLLSSIVESARLDRTPNFGPSPQQSMKLKVVNEPTHTPRNTCHGMLSYFHWLTACPQRYYRLVCYHHALWPLITRQMCWFEDDSNMVLKLGQAWNLRWRRVHRKLPNHSNHPASLPIRRGKCTTKNTCRQCWYMFVFACLNNNILMSQQRPNQYPNAPWHIYLH